MIYVLYHANCHDGFGAATAAFLKLGDDAEYIPVSYGKPLPAMEDKSKVFILDFSYDRQTLLDLDKRMERVVVLDHHASAQDTLSGLTLQGEESEIIFDMEKSGAVLAWEYFHDTPIPTLLAYIQDRDLWRWRLPQSRAYSAALASYSFDFTTWARWITEPTSFLSLHDQGLSILRSQDRQIHAMARHARLMLFTGSEILPWNDPVDSAAGAWIAPMANATTLFSEVAHQLLQDHRELPFAAYFSVRSDGRWQVGLRSRKGFDCSIIARSYGGGGHKQACGFTY